MFSTANKPPTLACPSDLYKVIPNGLTSAVLSWSYEELSDDTEQVARLECDPKRGSNFPTGSTNVLCTAIDDRNNKVDCQFSVTVCKLDVHKS